MTKLTNKEKRKLYLIGYKSFNKNRPTQDEHDLKMVKKIKECSRGGKVAIGVTSQYFYDSYDYNVEGYNDERIYYIPSHYTAYRHLYKEVMDGADCPTSVRIIEEGKWLNDYTE